MLENVGPGKSRINLDAELVLSGISSFIDNIIDKDIYNR